MTEKFEGIVLRTFKYSDSLMVADIYTKSRGRLSFLVPVSHNKRSKVRNVLFQPLSMLSFTASFKKGSMSRVQEVQPYTMLLSLQGDVVKSSIALYLSELLTYSLREGGEDESLFNFLDSSFTLLDNLETGYSDFHLVFMVQLLRYLGIYPNIEDCNVRSYFDLQQGCTVSLQPLHGYYLPPAETTAFVELLRTGYDTMHRLSLNRELRDRYLAILSMYYRLHIPEFPQLKSLDVLRELFN